MTMIDKLKIKLKHKIVTVTLNPVLDKTLWIKEFKKGGTFLVEKSKTIAAGKGVNVSRALLNIGITSIATGILAEGGKTLYLHLLNKEDIKNDFLFTDGLVRTNITIISDSKGRETHLRERGPYIDVSILRDFQAKLRSISTKNTFFVFSGSLPSGLPMKSYFDLINTVKEHGSDVFLDASGKALRKALKAKPFCIKPNIYEVEDAIGFRPQSSEDFVRVVNDFHEMGIKNVMISRGSRGIIISQGKEIIHARINIPNSINAVGSGDAALAGGLIGILSNLSIQDTARLACAFGGANTLESGASIFHTQDVIDLFHKVKIKYY